ncbi:S10 family peptidase [Caulobacter sp. SL161]|uniref:S10 family peptidase n=1 Tax=Caulobacter sp. SL161 TaxID=2995156 RepID=UPI002274DF36|nr:S10 family peptidase [Caulobacter sp. SL161]MCY1645720.1 S10 family peptidase [Caulobacter sp. SL161]
MKQSFRSGLLALVAVAALSGPGAFAPAAFAQDKGGDKPAAEKSASDLPAFPAEKSVKQTTVLAGKALAYTATVGALPVRDEKGKKIAEVVYTAYTLDGPRDPKRPITFAFNGGPGAASVYLNFALGPKRVQFGAEGDSPSDFSKLDDNPASWLDFTDLVFIDPVGTGFSRSLVNEDETKKRFYGVKQDIDYLSRIVFDYLVKTDRLTAPKYLVGESYGGFRGPRLAYTLQTDLGVAVKGVVLVSPLLTSAGRVSQEISPLPAMWTLPSIAAAKLERDGKLTPESIKAVEDYTRGEYMVDLMRGSDPAALDRLTAKVSAMTGLDPTYVRRVGGRLETQSFLREVFRDKGRLGSRYDSNVTSLDPFPFAPEQEVNDPILDAIIAPTTSAIVDFTTRVVGWKPEARYEALSYKVNGQWDRGRGPDTESVTDLRKIVSVDPKLKVLIVHGYNDLSCPFFASRLIVDAMPATAQGRVILSNYAGGHMFYSRPDSGAAFRKDVMALYGAK